MQVLSVVFHPLLLPTIMFFVIFRYVPQAFRPLADENVPYILLALSTTTLIIPVLSLLALRLTSTIKSLQMQDKKDRLIPFSFITTFYAVTTYMFYSKLTLNPVLVLLMLTTTLLIVILTVVTYFWKISIHSAGIGGVIGFILALVHIFPGSELLVPFIISIVILGWVMTARLLLQAHTFSQVAAGAVLGVGFCSVMMVTFN
jgi:membrane-associated phospholipid phosphatase